MQLNKTFFSLNGFLTIFAANMRKNQVHIEKQLKLIKLTKILMVGLLSLSFILEFVLLNLISSHKEQKVIVTTVSYEKVSYSFEFVADTITITVSQKFEVFLDYLKKQYEEQNRSRTENYHFTAFHLFLNDRFSFQFKNVLCLVLQSDTIQHYQMPFTQGIAVGIFRPPQV